MNFYFLCVAKLDISKILQSDTGAFGKKKKKCTDFFFLVMKRYTATQFVLCSHPYCVIRICIRPFLCVHKCD